MNVNKNLFMYNLAAVTIVRDEAQYIKEWIDYHLLAGVEHFLIYDNDSLDNLQEVLAPYIAKNLVTHLPAPKTHRQLEVYNDAIRYFKYFCRQMIFIDVDEFILPQDGRIIPDVVEEIFDDTNAAGLAINLHTFGSNNFEKADREKGVLERFTRRAGNDWAPLENDMPSGNAAVKVIVDPRRIKLFSDNAHIPEFFEGYNCVNEKGVAVTKNFSVPITADKIVINYYATYSREEYAEKVHRRETARYVKRNELVGFDANDRNEVEDEKILAYREDLHVKQIPEGGDFIKIFAEKNRINGGRMLKALVESLTPDFDKGNLKKYFESPKNRATYFNDLVKFYRKAPPAFFDGKVETYLTCLAVSSYLKKSYLDETTGELFEEASLNALCQTFLTKITLIDLRLIIAELPRLLAIPYSTIKSLITVCLETFPQFLEDFRVKDEQKNLQELNYIIRMLQTFAEYKK